MSFAYDPSGLTLSNAHFIGGEYVAGAAALNVVSPSNGTLIGEIPCADADVVDRAVQSARTALATSNWGGMQPRDRTRALCAWADLMEAEAETLAALEAICSPLRRGISRSRWRAGSWDRRWPQAMPWC